MSRPNYDENFEVFAKVKNYFYSYLKVYKVLMLILADSKKVYKLVN